MSEEVVNFNGDLFRATGTPHGAQVVIGRGVEHVVVNHPYFDQLAREGDPTAAVVQKISMLALRACNSGTPEENVAKAIGLAKQRNRRYTQLREIFGKDLVPEETTYACRLHMYPADIANLLPDLATNGMDRVLYATQTWQDKVWPLDARQYDQTEVLQLRLPYAERQKPPVDEATYTAVNDRWITCQAHNARPTDEETRQLLAVQRSPWLAELLAEATHNRAVYAAIKRIVVGTIAYGRQFGETLDFMGDKNAIVTKDGQAALVDVLVPPEVPYLREMPAVLQKVSGGEALSRREAMTLLNTLGHVRTVNFLAAWLGLSERLDHAAHVGLNMADWAMIHRVLINASESSDLQAETQLYSMQPS